MKATDAARKIADLFYELEDAGFTIGGHWSGDLLINRESVRRRLGIHDDDWSEENFAGLGFEETSQSGFWKTEYPRQVDEVEVEFTVVDGDEG